MNACNRVVVTGLGVISAIGTGRKKFWEAALSGASGINEVSSFDTSSFKCHRAGEVKNFNPEEFIPKRKVKFLGRSSQLAIAAASLAIQDAGFELKTLPKNKLGVLIGTTMGEKPIEELAQIWAKGGLKDIDRRRILQSSANNISANVAMYAKARGQNYLFPTACAAGNYAIGYGFDLIRSRDIDYALAGGAEAFSYTAFVGFQRLYAMATDKCQPFDKNRKGMMLGEGSAMLLLERLDLALERKREIYAEIIGYGLSCDAHHATAPEVRGVSQVMEKALKECSISYKDVDYICAHGTGTPMNDRIEAQAIKNVFKERAKEIPVNALKSMLGHSMGAASAIEAVSCCLSAKFDTIPPTINYETPDPQCDIDCVPNTKREKIINIAMNNAFAFGGNNSSLVIKKFIK
ncbi:MAG: beta-ketoacyl-[acyl-carrier-protein] synthase family protein [Candidatus Omnitrophota bacterium]|nr:beta-ketoacyl-[acyl-carrier-protein] synthase family protein [Candidatus Omnitrophota bacterium]